jgi:hypothetical protein
MASARAPGRGQAGARARARAHGAARVPLELPGWSCSVGGADALDACLRGLARLRHVVDESRISLRGSSSATLASTRCAA